MEAHFCLHFEAVSILRVLLMRSGEIALLPFLGALIATTRSSGLHQLTVLRRLGLTLHQLVAISFGSGVESWPFCLYCHTIGSYFRMMTVGQLQR